MVIVGGKNSANTIRLAQIARQYNANTQHVETEKEINWELLEKCKSVGVTAGASTPSWMIKRVVDHLRFLEQTRHTSIRTVFWQLLDGLANLNIFIAASASALYFTSCYLQGIPFFRRGALLAMLYMLSMYLWNSLTSIDITRHLSLSRHRFYHVRKHSLYALAIACIVVILYTSFASGSLPLFYLMVVAVTAGSLYHLSIVPSSLRKYFKYSNLRDIPTSRDLFVALAWGLLITFIPHAMQDRLLITWPTAIFFVYLFSLAYLRSLIFDLRDIEGDRIMGRETLVTIIGEKKARRLIQLCLGCMLLLLTAFSLYALSIPRQIPRPQALAFLFQVPVVVYMAFFLKWSHKLSRQQPVLFNICADGAFYISGIMSVLVALGASVHN
jgi:4-hydroxy-3-methylbut-2-enyl diphosphate reductase